MKTSQNPIAALSDAGLISEVQRLVRCERTATAALLRSLMEFDKRKLYLGEGYPSLFAYCTQVLHYAEHAALNRIEVARAAKSFPILLDHVTTGALNLTGARLLAPHLTDENCQGLLDAARHKSKRQIEEMIAALRPKPAVAPTVRKLPNSPTTAEPARMRVAEESAMVSRAALPVPNVPTPIRPTIAPLSPERYKVQFTITRETRDKLRQVQDLMRHAIPSGDSAAIFDRALTVLLEDLQRKRFAATSSRSRVDQATRTRGASLPQCGGQSGNAMAVAARSSVRMAAAANMASSNSTMLYRLRWEARQRSRTSALPRA